jgi:hypothetical protein
MDRTVPKTGSEEIELYMRTYYSLLRSTHTVQIETLVETHMAMESSLHVLARSPEPDAAALTYSSLRLPTVMADIHYVVVGQLERSFIKAGYPVTEWERVYSPGRRRRSHFDGDHTLAVFIASRSDIDDIIPMLTAYQIEWNKLHFLLQGEIPRLFLAQNKDRRKPLSDSELEMLAHALQMSPADLQRLELIWRPHFFTTLNKIAKAQKKIGLRLLTGSLADYRRGTASWWTEIQTALGDSLDLTQRPVYFVSSNTHSLVNLLTGFGRRKEPELLAYMEERGQEELLREYRLIQQDGGSRNLDNFLYYVLKKYLADAGPAVRDELLAYEAEVGIHRIPSRHGFDIETQVIELNKLRPPRLDPRLCEACDFGLLPHSDAVILNIDYPLGLAAYEILSRVTEYVGQLLGVYVMGKAATLNGRVGDISISNVVHDEHSQNTYLFNNCFTATEVAPYMTYGMVLDNQKAISAPGTFLQNPRYMSVFYHEGYTVIEMEGGPYLSSIYEAVRPLRHPQNEIVNLYGAPFDVGFLHYASDTPMSKGKNLGAGSLSYAGVEPTYATAVAIMRRIMAQELARLGSQLPPLGVISALPIVGTTEESGR